MLNIVGKRALFFVISAVFILIGVISLFTFGLRPGIEFSSGSIITLGFEQEVNEADLSQELASLGYGNAVIQTTGGGDFLIRLTELTDAEKTQLEEGLCEIKELISILNCGSFSGTFLLQSPDSASFTDTVRKFISMLKETGI